MKLQRLYIENFGVLSEYELIFDEHITELLHDNGAGKSTLTVFLQTMFYGFPRANKNLDKDLRRKYLPWQGGVYGGYIEFLFEEQVYRLERRFGERPNLDTFALYELEPLKPSNRFSQDIGIELFGLDAESFARSTYVPQQALSDALGVPGILTGLTSLVENTEDVYQYEDALEVLKKQRSALLPYRGRGGVIERTAGQITQLQGALDRMTVYECELETLTSQLSTHEAALVSCNKEIDLLQDQIADGVQAALRQQLYQEYQRLVRESDRLGNQIQSLTKDYPQGFPPEEVLEGAETALMQADQREYLLLEEQLAESGEILEQIAQTYPEGLPSLEEINEKQTVYDRLLETLDELEDNQKLLEQDHEANQHSNADFRKMGILLMAATASLMAGTLSFLFQKPLPGGILLTLGIGILLFIMIGNQKQKVTSDEEIQLLDRQGLLREQEQVDDEALKAWLLGYFSHTSIGEYHLQLHRLKLDLEKKETHTLRLADGEAKSEQLKQSMEQARSVLQCFAKQYGLTESMVNLRGLNKLREDHIHYQNYQENYRYTSEQLSAFLLDHGPQEPPCFTMDSGSLAKLQERLTNTCKEQQRLLQQITEERQEVKQRRDKVEQRPALQDQLTEQLQLLERYKHQAYLLDETIAHLKQARESLTVSYLDKIKSSFLYYYHQVTTLEEPDQTIHLSTELELALDRQGAARELASFSTGNTDLYMFCMRLALIDALYPEDKPLLILDDPFVNLDIPHTKKVAALLGNLTNQQILYLTCHPSRSITDQF